MPVPILFHDPTSEPCRAVHWFAVEAGIQLEIGYIWLTRGDHRAAEFLEINPAHQVPALKHGAFCLPEATAIMMYLAERAGMTDRWIGENPIDRAQTHRFLSWHHTNTRLKLTLDYFLPALLMPAYKGISPPEKQQVRRLRTRGRESIELLEGMLKQRGEYLGGGEPSIADIFIASDLYALDIDPEWDGLFGGFPAVRAWMSELRLREGYRVSHGAWNALVPRVKELLTATGSVHSNAAWVADLCEAHLVK